MVIVALLGAVLLYLVLGYLWVAAQPQLNTTPPILNTLRHLIIDLPQPTPLGILKLGILLFAFYVIADGLFSYSAKRRRRARRGPSAKDLRGPDKDAAPPAQDA